MDGLTSPEYSGYSLVCGTGEMRNSNKIIVRKLQGTRTVVRHRLRCEDDIRMYHIVQDVSLLTRHVRLKYVNTHMSSFIAFLLCTVNIRN
jgi:hypothetical protein